MADVDPEKVEAARVIEDRLGYDRQTERAATEDDQVVGGLRMVLDQALFKYGLPPEAGLTGLLRHLEGNRALTHWAQDETIRLLQRRVEHLVNGVQCLTQQGDQLLAETDWANEFDPGPDEGQQAENPMVTKTGKVLTDADIEDLSAEAERGHDG